MPIIINRHAYFSYHSYIDRLQMANQKPSTNYIICRWECKNCKSDFFKLHTFACKHLRFRTGLELETLEMHLYSSSLLACKILDKSGVWPKSLVELAYNVSVYQGLSWLLISYLCLLIIEWCGDRYATFQLPALYTPPILTQLYW